MKTHVIQLNHFDDFISIKDKISWSKASRILVVWPDHGKILLTHIDLLLILRQADALGAQLAFVSDDQKLVELSKEVGIQVFESIPSAYKSPWRRSKWIKRRGFEERKSKKIDMHQETFQKTEDLHFLNSRLVRIPFFILGLLAVGALVAFFVPSASLGVEAVSEVKTLELAISANPDTSMVNFSGAVPAHIVYVDVEDSYDGISNGYVRIPGLNSSGELTFRNLTEGEVRIPAGTIVRTANDPLVRFQTNSLLVLPEGINSIGRVRAICLEGGVVGNVPPYTVTAIEGIVGGSVAVENPSSFSGGTDIKTLTPSEDDYAKASEALKISMKNKADDLFRSEFTGINLFVDGTLTQEAVIFEERFPEVNLPGERFTLRMKSKYSIWTISNNDLIELVILASKSIIDEGETIDLDSIQIANTSSPRFDTDSNLRWTISAKMIVKPEIDEAILAGRLAGLSMKEAERLIERDTSLKLINNVVINPLFWNRMPYLSFRIGVHIDG